MGAYEALQGLVRLYTTLYGDRREGEGEWANFMLYPCLFNTDLPILDLRKNRSNLLINIARSEVTQYYPYQDS